MALELGQCEVTGCTQQAVRIEIVSSGLFTGATALCTTHLEKATDNYPKGQQAKKKGKKKGKHV